MAANGCEYLAQYSKHVFDSMVGFQFVYICEFLNEFFVGPIC